MVAFGDLTGQDKADATAPGFGGEEWDKEVAAGW